MSDAISSLLHTRLGDVVRVARTGDLHTVRASVELPEPVQGVAGFVVCGEMVGVLAVPQRRDGRVRVFVPVNVDAIARERHRRAAAGATRYWSPHLPASPGAAPVIEWAVDELPARPDPAILVWQGKQLTVFIRAADVDPRDVQVLPLPTVATEDDVERYSGLMPVSAPAPAATPSPVPAHATSR